MIKLDLTTDEIQILVEMLDTAISEIRMEIMQTDSREYRKMLQEREILLKNMFTTMSASLEERRIAEIA
jgi:hypothetical protein